MYFRIEFAESFLKLFLIIEKNKHSKYSKSFTEKKYPSIFSKRLESRAGAQGLLCFKIGLKHFYSVLLAVFGVFRISFEMLSSSLPMFLPCFALDVFCKFQSVGTTVIQCCRAVLLFLFEMVSLCLILPSEKVSRALIMVVLCLFLF